MFSENVQWLDYAVMSIYLIAVVVIGIYFSRDEKNSSDYLLGGRKMPVMAIGISVMMSLLSSISIVAVPGEIFNHGLTLYTFNLLLPIMAIPAFLIFIRFYFKLNSFTPYEYLEKRYNSKVRVVVAASALYSRFLYLGTILFATSKMFEGAFQWPAEVTILLVGIIGVTYTVLGGMKAVVWSDVMQFFVLAVGVVIILTILCLRIDGGAVGAVTYAFEHGRNLDYMKRADFYYYSPYVRFSFWILLWNAIYGPLTMAASDQVVVQRMLSVKTWKHALKAQILSSAITIPTSLMLFFIGLAVFTFYGQNPDPAIGPRNGDIAFFSFIRNYMPSPLLGLFMAGMLAAIMSSLDSSLNSAAALWLKEFHQKYINKKLTDANEVKISRIATLIFGIAAILFGLLMGGSSKILSQSVVEVTTIFYLFAVATMPAFLFAVFSRRANSTLVWLLTAYGFGSAWADKIWYALSTYSKNNWKAGEAFGWAGPLEASYLFFSLCIALTLVVIWFVVRRTKGWGFGMGLAAALGMGFFQNILVWYAYSNTLITDVPLARSFAFSLPISLFFGVIALFFCKIPSREKYFGLTLATVNEEMLVEGENKREI